MLGCPGHRSISTHNNDNKVKNFFFSLTKTKTLFVLKINNELKVQLSTTVSKEQLMLSVILISSDVKHLGLLSLLQHIKTISNRALYNMFSVPRLSVVILSSQ